MRFGIGLVAAFGRGGLAELLAKIEHVLGFLVGEPGGVFAAAWGHAAVAAVGFGGEDVGGLVGDDGRVGDSGFGEGRGEGAGVYVAGLAAAGGCFGVDGREGDGGEQLTVVDPAVQPDSEVGFLK